jgi:hypothetical protein
MTANVRNTVTGAGTGAGARYLPADVDTVLEVASPAMAAATSFQHNMIETLSACQKEWFEFLNKRWHENLEMPARLAQCRSPGDFQRAYVDYWSRAADQYQTEFKHLGEIVHTKPHQAAEAPEASGKLIRPVGQPAGYQSAA